jgi:GWxTD domain-containing protein
MSTPLFCRAAAAPPVPEKFAKFGLAVLPQVTRAYGSKEESASIFLEVYTPGDTTPELVLEAVSFNRYQNHTRIDSVRFAPQASGINPVVLNIPIAEFEPGEITLTLKLSDGSRALVDDLVAMYRVEWSLHSMMGHDWQLVVDQLVHIAAPKELKALRDAEQEDREEMLEAFWKSKDPTPETPDNEWKNEYYRRIRFADAHYTNPYRRGWRTDFGMVYIKYGEPDQVERYPFELGQKPYEIWYYYTQGRKFVFVDAKGNDDYQLQPPYDGGRH